MQTATDARQRVYGVSEEEAPRQEAGTALGRLWRRGEITQAQMEAGLSYAEIHRACVAYEQCPKGLEKTEGGGSQDWDSPDFDAEAYTERAVSAIARYHALRVALEREELASPVFLVAIKDIDPLSTLVPAVSKGLGILAHNLRIT